MALVDVIGAIECATTEGYLDVTHRRFEVVIWDLLPRGFAWDREDPVMLQLVAALATEPSRVDKRAQKLRRELDPATTFELLTDWEEMLGLPECSEPETLEARRAAILAKLLAQVGHDQGLAYWEGLLDALGYELEWIDKGKTPMTCADDCIDVLYDEEWLFVWALVVAAGLDEELLECIVGHQAQIETLPLVHVLWEFTAIPEGAGTIRGIASTANGYTVAVGDDGLVRTASPELETWSVVAAPTVDDFLCVCEGGTEGGVLIAAGAAGVAFLSTDGGASWTAATNATALSQQVYDLSRGHAADAVVVAVGAGGLIARSVDGGDTWAAVLSPVADDLYAVTRCHGALVAVLADAVIRSTNSGVTWSVIGVGGGEDLFGVDAWGDVVIAVGSAGTIVRSADAGLTWTAMVSPTTKTLRAVASSATGRWVACGDDETVVHSLDGITWTLCAVEGGDGSDLYAAGAGVPFGRLVVAGGNLNAFVE